MSDGINDLTRNTGMILRDDMATAAPCAQRTQISDDTHTDVPDWCNLALHEAASNIRSLKSALAERDERIASLYDELVRTRKESDEAREAIQIVVALYNDWLEYRETRAGAIPTTLAERLGSWLTHDQLRACGIEEP